MWTFGPRKNNNIQVYWYVKGRVVVPLMSLVVLVNFEVGCWKIYRHVWNNVCILANNKNQKQEPKTDKSCSYLSALFDQTQTQRVSFFTSPSHHPSLHECTVPYCSPGNFSKGVRWEENRQKEKDGDKKMKTFFLFWRSKGVECYGFQEKASRAVN